MRLLPALWLLSACQPAWEAQTPDAPTLGPDELVSLGDVDAVGRVAESQGVPQDLILALAWHESSLGEPTEVHHGEAPREFGWLGLSAEEVADAAALTGLGEGEIRDDRGANLIAGAALLRELAEDAGAQPNPRRPDASWWSAVTAWNGEAEAWANDEYALDVYATLQDGLDVLAASGERVVISPWELPDLEDIELHEAPASDQDEFSGVRGYPGRARYLPASSSNYSYRPGGTSAIRRVVMHTTEGSYNSAISWFRNPNAQVSAHYVVRRSDGQVTQMVPDDMKAWHACSANTDTIGIEQEGHASSASTWTPQLVESSARLTGWLVRKYHIPADRQHIVSHGEVQPSYCDYRYDPGPHFPWGRFMRKVRAYSRGEDPSGSVKFIHPQPGETVGNPVFVRVKGSSNVDRMDVWVGARRIGRALANNPADLSRQLGRLGVRHFKVKAFDRHGALLAQATTTARVRETDDLDPTVHKIHRRTYGFRAETAPQIRFVRYWVGGRPIRDLYSDHLRATGGEHLLVHRFSKDQRNRLLVARGYDQNDRLVAEGHRYFDVTNSRGATGAWGDLQDYGDTGEVVSTDGEGLYGTTVLLTSDGMNGAGVAHVRYLVGTTRLTDDPSGEDFADGPDFSMIHTFGEPGPVNIRTRALDAQWELLGERTTRVWVPSPELIVDWRRQGSMHFVFDAVAPAGTQRVVYSIDGWNLPDDDTGHTYGQGGGFPLDYSFNTGGTRHLRAEARDPAGNVLDAFEADIQVW